MPDEIMVVDPGPEQTKVFIQKGENRRHGSVERARRYTEIVEFSNVAL